MLPNRDLCDWLDDKYCDGNDDDEKYYKDFCDYIHDDDSEYTFAPDVVEEFELRIHDGINAIGNRALATLRRW